MSAVVLPYQAHGGGARNTRVSPSDVAVYRRLATNVEQRRFKCLPSFYRTRRTVAGRGTLTFPPLTWPSTVVLPLTSSRDDSVVCRRSSIQLRPSCRAGSAKTILRSAVVLSFCRSVVLSFCRSVVLAFCRSGVLLPLSRPSFFVSLVTFRRRLAASIFAAHLGFVSVNLSGFIPCDNKGDGGHDNNTQL